MWIWKGRRGNQEPETGDEEFEDSQEVEPEPAPSPNHLI